MPNVDEYTRTTRNMDTRLLSTKEVREMTGLSKNTVLKLLNTGVLPGVKLGAQWFILEDELIDALRITKED